MVTPKLYDKNRYWKRVYLFIQKVLIKNTSLICKYMVRLHCNIITIKTKYITKEVYLKIYIYMRKKQLFICAIIIFLAIFTVIIILLTRYTGDKDLVYLSLVKEVYDKKEKEITINIHNDTKKQYIYGERYDFQVYKDNKWEDVAYVDNNLNLYFADVGLVLEPNSVKHEILRLDLYSISSGQYRYIKKVNNKELIVKFIIK